MGILGVRSALADSRQAAKPLVVFSFSGYDELMGDIGFAGGLGGHPDLNKNLEGILGLMTKGKGLAGVDKTRPWGAVIQTDNGKPTGYGFVPVTDLKALLALLEALGRKSKDAGDGITQIETGRRNKPVYVRQNKGWAFVSDKRENLADLPADPGKLVAGLTQQYDWAVRVNVCNVPAKHREKFIRDLQKRAEKRLARIRGSEQEVAIGRMVGKKIVGAIVAAANEMEQVTLGCALDRSAKTAFLEMNVTALKGTGCAKQFANLGNAKTNFAGFQLPGAAVTGNLTFRHSLASEEELAALGKAIRTLAFERIDAEVEPKEKAEGAKKFVNGILEVAGKAIASGRVDRGMSLVLEPDAATLVAAKYVADGQKLEETLGLLVEAARKEHPDLVKKSFKANADEHQGVRLHVISLPIPKDAKDREKVVQLIGETLEVVVGIGKKDIYLAAGKDAMKTLKQAIDQSKAKRRQAVSPMRLSVSLSQLAEFVAEVGKEKDKPTAKKAAEILAKTAGKDHINLLATPIDRGVKCRLEIEEGVLKLLGEAENLRKK